MILRFVFPSLCGATETSGSLPLLITRPEGDIIKINIPEMTLELDVSDEVLAERRKNWTPREPKVTTGYLARYASMVTSGNRGAILAIDK